MFRAFVQLQDDRTQLFSQRDLHAPTIRHR